MQFHLVGPVEGIAMSDLKDVAMKAEPQVSVPRCLPLARLGVTRSGGPAGHSEREGVGT